MKTHIVHQVRAFKGLLLAGIIENITQEDITISDDEKKYDRIPFLFVIRSLAKANKCMHCFIFGIQALSVW